MKNCCPTFQCEETSETKVLFIQQVEQVDNIDNATVWSLLQKMDFTESIHGAVVTNVVLRSILSTYIFIGLFLASSPTAASGV